MVGLDGRITLRASFDRFRVDLVDLEHDRVLVGTRGRELHHLGWAPAGYESGPTSHGGPYRMP